MACCAALFKQLLLAGRACSSTGGQLGGGVLHCSSGWQMRFSAAKRAVVATRKMMRIGGVTAAVRAPLPRKRNLKDGGSATRHRL